MLRLGPWHGGLVRMAYIPSVRKKGLGRMDDEGSAAPRNFLILKNFHYRAI